MFLIFDNWRRVEAVQRMEIVESNRIEIETAFRTLSIHCIPAEELGPLERSWLGSQSSAEKLFNSLLGSTRVDPGALSEDHHVEEVTCTAYEIDG